MLTFDDRKIQELEKMWKESQHVCVPNISRRHMTDVVRSPNVSDTVEDAIDLTASCGQVEICVLSWTTLVFR